MKVYATIGAGLVIAAATIVTAQQTLANSINAYLASLNEYWSAVVDLAELLQLEDVFATIPGAWEKLGGMPPEPGATSP